MLRVRSPTGEDFYFYDRTWGKATYTNKVVLDIGADVGSTADYFLQKGASKVIAVEADENYFRGLLENCRRPEFSSVEPLLLKVCSPEDIEMLIDTYTPDIVKSDCEGCESVFEGVQNEILRKVPEYIIECHGDNIERLRKKFREAGFEEVGFNPWAGYSATVIFWRRIDGRP